MYHNLTMVGGVVYSIDPDTSYVSFGYFVIYSIKLILSGEFTYFVIVYVDLTRDKHYLFYYSNHVYAYMNH